MWEGNDMHRSVAIGFVTFLALAACGGGSDGKTVGKADFGDAWPLTVEQGTLRCEGGGGVGAVTIEVDGVTYALNGTAKSQKKGQDIQPIWAPNPDIAGSKKDIGVLIDEGLKLCA